MSRPEQSWPPAAITSVTNPRVKALVRLRRRRARDDAGVTLVEGFEELELALAAGVVPRTLYVCPELMLDPDRQHDLAAQAQQAGAELIVMARAPFEKVAYREGPDGFLAVLPRLGLALADLDLPAEPFLLVAEGLEKPGNLGAIVRSAEAAGVHAVIAVDPVTDWGNPNVVRASKGSVYAVPVATATGLAEFVAWARQHGIRLLAATPAGADAHSDTDLTGPLAIAVGTEKQGLTGEFLAAADAQVRIPMAGRINSLNVSVAAAVVLFEAVRQRAR